MIIKTTLFSQRRFLGSLCCLLFFVSCRYEANNKTYENVLRARMDKAAKCIDSAKILIQDYDIVTRAGTDFTSRGLRKLCFKDQTYSHCGIAHYENDTLFVYHAVGGESSPDEVLHRDPLEIYASGSGNEALGIFRFHLPDAAVKYRIDSLIKFYYRKKIKFDLQFDLSTDDKMYCAEFVAKVFSRAFQTPEMFATHTVQDKEYIAPDDIYLQQECTEIKRFSYY